MQGIRSLSLLQIRQAVMATVAQVKEIPLERVNDKTSLLPSRFPGERPIQDTGNNILDRLGCRGECDTSLLRGSRTVASFTFWVEKELREKGFSIVSPRANDIREVVMRCIEGHYKLSHESSLDDLTMINRKACIAIAQELVLTQDQLPTDTRMTLYDLMRWVGDAVVTRAMNPPPPKHPERRSKPRTRTRDRDAHQ